MNPQEQVLPGVTAGEEENEIVDLTDHYTEAGMDYEYWSQSFNMHFGYWHWRIKPWDRESMLDEMTNQVSQQLPPTTAKANVADFGCGVGAPMRWLAGKHPKLTITGFTIVPWQINKASELTADSAEGHRLHYKLADYRMTGLAAGSMDAVYSIEATCHDLGLSKAGAIKEAARVLKPGGRFIVTDGFLRRGRLPRLLNGLFNLVCHNWALDTFAGLPQFKDTMRRQGLHVVYERDISWRVGPSALQIPWVTMRWLMSSESGRISSTRWRHILACLAAPLVGLCLPWFSYKVIVAEKRSSDQIG